MRIKAYITFFLICSFLSGCSGYQVVKNTNPFARYGITSIAVPMMVNRSVFSNAGSEMTKKILETLSRYPGLRVYNRVPKAGDALLIGVVDSKNKLVDANQITGREFISDELKESIGKRREFYIPKSNTVELTTKFYLVQNPVTEEIQEIIKKNGLLYSQMTSKILFQHNITSSASYTRVNLPRGKGGEVNFTKNFALMQDAIATCAENAAKDFNELVLNAF